MDTYGAFSPRRRAYQRLTGTLPGQNQNHWQWAKLLDAGKEDSICFAYRRDRIAVAFPRMGVKVWIWIKGRWVFANAWYYG